MLPPVFNSRRQVGSGGSPSPVTRNWRYAGSW